MNNNKNRWRVAFELLVEAIVILALELIGYLGIIFVFIAISEAVYPKLLAKNSHWVLYFPRFQRYFLIGFTVFYIVAGIVFLIWRLYRRQRAIQLGYILDELHYISRGHLDRRISAENMGSLKPVVNSINRLVDSTVQAMDEERRIEKSKDELIANMSHDIRTPLTSIIGYLGLIQSGHFDSKEQAMEYAGIAYKKALQMQDMVEDLFEYTKVSQVSAKLDIQEVDAVGLLNQLAAEYEMEASEAGRVMEVDTGSQDQILIEMDTEKIVRVFSNLITNAFKYGGEGEYVRLSAHQDTEKTTFAVADDGNQIPQEELGNLFKRFYQVDRSRNAKGSGLGLAIAESIVRLHHGKIWAESDEESTRFIFTLPNHYEQETKEADDE